ncbi:Histidine phosphatase superfamily clade-2 [Trinorchestia longiramus]|nr:Histidine phosphatase superfamily clade-2 [Trinorchestia longiramus]
MINIQTILWVLCFLCLPSNLNAFAFEKNCINHKESTDKSHFATKTTYANAKTSFSEDIEISNPYIEKVSDTCSNEPVLLWLITRHGIRYPIKSEVQRFSAMLPIIAQELVFNHKESRGCFTEAEAEVLEKFVMPYSIRDAAQLSETGADEQFKLGQFWRELFPHLFEEPFSEDLYEVEFTAANRTGQSAYHFLRGAFGEQAAANIPLPQPHSPNFKLRPYKSCPAWVRDVLKGKTTRQEQRLYQEEPEFQSMWTTVSQRLGYSQTMSLDDLMLVYEECRYEIAWWPDRDSVWCKPFSDQDILVLEYHQALRYFYEVGYGGPEINLEMACSAVADMYKHMRDYVEGTSSRRAMLYFSHDREILLLYTALGLFKPTSPLTHQSRADHVNGSYAISSIAPFSTSLAFVLYRCKDGSHRVGGYHQGLPLSLSPLCPDDTSGTCVWPPPKIQEVAQSCRIRQLCHAHDEL